MPSVTRLLGLVCTFATCDFIFPPPLIPIVPPTNIPLITQTNLGKVHGYYMSSLSGKYIGGFEGIPYAEPPVGHRRFKNPIKKKTWEGTLDARKTSPVCIQMDPSKYYRVIGQEDCLYLNVYIPLNRNKNKNIPVLIWIHGGGFYWGAGSLWGPTYLLDQDIILVTLNYRLGPLGFLSTGDSASSGNYGLKDQSMAIAWVQENIKSFGGNPNRITIAGQSAGAASVHLHMMSPKTKDKIHGAISQSGTALSHWAIPPNQHYYYKRLAESVRCSSHNSTESVRCLRSKTAMELIYQQYNLFQWMENPQILFGPVIEYDHPSAFITMKPKKYYERRMVAEIPWITGVTKDEGDLFSLVNYLGPLAIRGLVRNLDTVLPTVLMYNSRDTQTTKKIRDFYLSEFPKFSFSGFEALQSLSRMIGDRFFYVPFDKAIKLHSKAVRAPHYAYLFSFKGSHGTPEKFQMSPAEWGVMHMDDIQYLFNSTEIFAPISKFDKEYSFAQRFIDVWVNFVKTGIPQNTRLRQYELSSGDYWERYSINNNKSLLEINSISKMIEEPYENRINFWKSINHY